MTKITNAKIQLETGQVIKSDAHGNNFAIICPNCNKYLVLIKMTSFPKDVILKEKRS